MPRVWDVPVRDSTRVRDARVAAEGAAALAGLDGRRTAAAALVATELATNLLKHSAGGQVLIDIVAPPALREGRRQPRIVQIAAIDHGPGISDVPAVLRDGFSSTGSLGAGLGTCLRLADDFDLHSVPGRGTVAVARIGAMPHGAVGPAGPAVTVRADGVSGGWADGRAKGWDRSDCASAGRDRDGGVPGFGRQAGGAPVGEVRGRGVSVRGTAGNGAGTGDGPRAGGAPWSALPGEEQSGSGVAGRGLRASGAPDQRVPGAEVQAEVSRGRSTPVGGVRAGGVNIPYAGAEYSGDAWAWVRAGDRLTLMLADGLGHGPEAARASSAAVEALHRSAHLTPAESLRRLHEALAGTRGAAVALAQLDLRAGLLRFAGIGNVGARLRADGAWRPLLSRPGIVGVHRPATLREEEAAWAADRLLILHTDGLPSRWTPPSDAGPTTDPAVTAAVTIRDASSSARPVRDDTTVAVLTPTPPDRP